MLRLLSRLRLMDVRNGIIQQNLSQCRSMSIFYENKDNNVKITSKENEPDELLIDVISKEMAAKDMPVEMENPYAEKKSYCILCKYGVKLDYKNVKLLSQFVSPFTGRTYDKHITRLCSKQQKHLEFVILISKQAGYMAHMMKDVDFLKDPKIADPGRPIKPHKY